MTGVAFAALIRKYTRTNATTLTNADIVVLANPVKDDIAEELMVADEHYFEVPNYIDLVASRREYPLPDDNLGIARVEAKLDGTNFIKLVHADAGQYSRTTDETTIVSRFANVEGSAYYDIVRRSIYIYSGAITSVAGGLKLVNSTYPQDITVSTLNLSTDMSIDPSPTQFSLPRSLHELWARKISINYKSNREKPLPLTDQELLYDRDLRRKISLLTNQDKDTELLATVPDYQVY